MLLARRLCIEAFVETSLIFCLAFASGATLAPDEVNALREIAETIGKKDWNFSVDPCSGISGWNDSTAAKGFENGVTCNCTIPGSSNCHVVRILLKSQDLPGTLPSNLTKLPYLQVIDLTRNYLNGAIPREWGSTNLLNISLNANRISGSLPIELANITTLQEL